MYFVQNDDVIISYYSVVSLVVGTGSAFCGVAGAVSILFNSTLRFLARPSLVALSAIGLSDPYPFACKRSAATPADIRYDNTASARRVER
jgi:hypothetical protein